MLTPKDLAILIFTHIIMWNVVIKEVTFWLHRFEDLERGWRIRLNTAPLWHLTTGMQAYVGTVIGGIGLSPLNFIHSPSIFHCHASCNCGSDYTISIC
jgi:hypothetical protein